MFSSKVTTLAISVSVLLMAQTAAAEQMGRNGYNFPPRNPSLAAQFQFQQKMTTQSGGSATSGSSGLSALNQFVTTYSSNSTSIGNMNQVNQTLSEGSHGSVGQSTDQESVGSQGSEADTEATVDNSVTRLNTITKTTEKVDSSEASQEVTQTSQPEN